MRTRIGKAQQAAGATKKGLEPGVKAQKELTWDSRVPTSPTTAPLLPPTLPNNPPQKKKNKTKRQSSPYNYQATRILFSAFFSWSHALAPGNWTGGVTKVGTQCVRNYVSCWAGKKPSQITIGPLIKRSLPSYHLRVFPWQQSEKIPNFVGKFRK